MVEAEKYITDIGFVGLSKFILGFQALFLLPILTKFLGPADYGVWSQIKVTLALILPIASLGINRALGRYLTGVDNKQAFSKVWNSSFVFTLLPATVFSVVLFVLSAPLALWLTGIKSAAIWFQLASSLVFLRSLNGLIVQIFRIKKRFKALSAYQITNAILEISIIYLLLQSGMRVGGVVLAYIVVVAIMSFVAFSLNKQHLQRTSIRFENIKKHVKYGLYFSLIPLFHWIFQIGDQYVLGIFHGAEIVGIYALAYSVGYSMKIVAQSVTIVLYQQLVGLWNKGKKDQFLIYYNYSYKYLFLFLVPMTFGLIALSKEIVLLISTKEFLDAQFILPLIAFGLLLFMFWSFCSIVLEVQEKPNTIRNVFIVLMILNIGLNLLLVPKWSLYGAAIATLFTFIISFIYSIWHLKRSGYQLYVGFLLKAFLAGGVMWTLVWLMKPLITINLVAKILILVAFGIVIYFIAMFLLRAISIKEFRLLMKFVRGH